MSRPATHFVHVGANAIVPGRVAAYLERYAGLERFRREHRGQDAEVDEILTALHVVAASWRAGSGLGTTPPPRPEPASPSVQWVTPRTAALKLQMTDRGIRKAIAEKRLRAEKHDGRWRIHLEDIAHFTEGRRTE